MTTRFPALFDIASFSIQRVFDMSITPTDDFGGYMTTEAYAGIPGDVYSLSIVVYFHRPQIRADTNLSFPASE